MANVTAVVVQSILRALFIQQVTVWLSISDQSKLPMTSNDDRAQRPNSIILPMIICIRSRCDSTVTAFKNKKSTKWHSKVKGRLLLYRVEQMLEGLKMGWIFNRPARLARPTDDASHGLNTVSPLLGGQDLKH